MATTTALSMLEYLDTTYHPDREYVDGELRERNVGKWDHARLQFLIANWIGRQEEAWDIIGSTEQRVRVSPTRVRIPDLVVLKMQCPPPVLAEPFLLAIEVLSPDDTYAEMQERVLDLVRMGVENIWIIDPDTETGKMWIGTAWVFANRLEVANSPIHLDLSDLFARLNRTKR